MHWKETGGVEKLFTLPARPIPSRILFKYYQRNMTIRGENEEEHASPEAARKVPEADVDNNAPTRKSTRKRKHGEPEPAPLELEPPTPIPQDYEPSVDQERGNETPAYSPMSDHDEAPVTPGMLSSLGPPLTPGVLGPLTPGTLLSGGITPGGLQHGELTPGGLQLGGMTPVHGEPMDLGLSSGLTPGGLGHGGLTPGGLGHGGLTPGGLGHGGLTPGGLGHGGLTPGGLGHGGLTPGGLGHGGLTPGGLGHGGLTPGGLGHGGLTPAGLHHRGLTGSMTPSLGLDGSMTPGGLQHGGFTPADLHHGGMTPGGLDHGGLTPGGLSHGLHGLELPMMAQLGGDVSNLLETTPRPDHDHTVPMDPALLQGRDSHHSYQSGMQMTNLGYDEHHGAHSPQHDYDLPPSVEHGQEQEEREAGETEEQFSERVLNRRAAQLFTLIKPKLVQVHATITFSELAPRHNNRKQVAQKFYSLLVLKKHQVLRLEQEETYGPITITRGAHFDSDAL